MDKMYRVLTRVVWPVKSLPATVELPRDVHRCLFRVPGCAAPWLATRMHAVTVQVLARGSVPVAVAVHRALPSVENCPPSTAMQQLETKFRGTMA